VGSAESADIVIGDPSLAAEHFTILNEGGSLSIEVGETPVEIGGDTRSNGTFPLPPFVPIKFGMTCCAVGPEGGTWRAFSTADLLPVHPPAAAASLVAPESVTEPPIATPAPTPAAGELALTAPVIAPRGKSGPRLSLAVAVAVFVLCALGGGYFLLNSSNSEASSESEVTAQSIIAALQADGVRIRQDGQGLVAEGFVATNDQQRRLRQALLDADLGVKYRVVSLEQQVAAARTIVSTAGAQITVEANTKDGKLVLEGFLPDISHGETLQRILQRDIPELRPLEMRLTSLATVADEARKELASAGLDKVARVDVNGATIRISGGLPEHARTTVRAIADKLGGRWTGKATIEDATTPVAVPAPVPIQPTVTVRVPPAKFTVVVAGRDGFVRDSNGRRYIVGDKLANGEVIEEIRMEEIVTSKDGIKRRYLFGGSQ
jgi:type III secretion system YscD/HrpQ family protein